MVAGAVTDAATGVNLTSGRVDLLTMAGEPVQDQAPTAWIERGHFRFPTAVPGRYRVRISAEGYESQLSDPIIVEVGQTISIEVSLHPAAAGSAGEVEL